MILSYQDQNFTEIFRFSIIDDPIDNTSIENNASGSISGRVVDSNGTLVPAFEICVYDANHTDAYPPLLFSQYFDSNGSFEVLVEPGIYFLEIRGAHRSANSNQTQSFLSSFFDDGNSSADNYGSKIILSNDHLKYSRANWELEEIDFDSIHNSTDIVQVDGHVSGHGSVGLSGVVIEVRLKDNPLDPPLKRVVSDENGYYQISMPPGPWYFRAVDHTGFWSSQSLFRNLIFGIDEIGEDSLDFDLQEENLIEVSGRIVTLQGDPVRNARVLFNEQTTGAVFSLSHYGQFDSENGGFSCFLPKGKYLIEAIDPEGLHTSSWYGGIDSKSAKVVSGSADELILVMEKIPSVFLDIEFDFDANRTYASTPLLEIVGTR